MRRPVTPGAGGRGRGGIPPTSPGGPPPSDRDLEDEYILRMRVDSGDTQAAMAGTADMFEGLGGQVSRGAAAISAAFHQISGYLKQVGIDISVAGIANQLLDINQLTGDLRWNMYEASREATRGGGAMLDWTQKNEEVTRAYFNTAVEARLQWRRTEEQISEMFNIVAQSGVAGARIVRESSDEAARAVGETGAAVEGVGERVGRQYRTTTEVIKELGEAVRLGFQLEFLGLSAQQIQSLYHSMAVNLQMDIGQIKEQLYGLYVISHDTAFSFSEQMRMVEQALAQYSRFGVTIQDVVGFLDAIQSENEDLSRSFDNVGVMYELMMARLGIRTSATAQQVMTLLAMVSPQEFMTALGGAEQQAQFAERLTTLQRARGVAPEQMITLEQIREQGVSPVTAAPFVWGALREGQMNLILQSVMERLAGPVGGAAMLPAFAGLGAFAPLGPLAAMPWEETRRGIQIGSESMEALRDSNQVVAKRVEESKEAAEARGLKIPPTASAFFDTVGEHQRQIMGEITGWRADMVFYLGNIWRGVAPGPYGQAMRDALKEGVGLPQEQREALVIRREEQAENVRRIVSMSAEAGAERTIRESIEAMEARGEEVSAEMRAGLRAAEESVRERARLVERELPPAPRAPLISLPTVPREPTAPELRMPTPTPAPQQRIIPTPTPTPERIEEMYPTSLLPALPERSEDLARRLRLGAAEAPREERELVAGAAPVTINLHLSPDQVLTWQTNVQQITREEIASPYLWRSWRG